jgi:tRNA threonylcarbamoyladenosine biosynthesis protein TsaE
MISIKTTSYHQTIELGREFSRFLRGKDIVILSGALGGGKTTFVKGILQGLGYRGRVLSPSFVLLRQYKTKTMSVYHLDLYRLESQSDIFSLGVDEYMGAGASITLIEWGEKIEPMLKDYIKVSFSYCGESIRQIKFSFTANNSKRFEIFKKKRYIKQ